MLQEPGSMQSLVNVISKLVTVYSFANCFLYFTTKHLKIYPKVFNFRELLHTKGLVNSSCCIFFKRKGQGQSLNNRHLPNIPVYLSSLLWCFMDGKLTLALYGLGVGF